VICTTASSRSQTKTSRTSKPPFTVAWGLLRRQSRSSSDGSGLRDRTFSRRLRIRRQRGLVIRWSSTPNRKVLNLWTTPAMPGPPSTSPPSTNGVGPSLFRRAPANTEETGDLAVKLVERVGVLASHLQIEDGCERRLIDCFLVGLSLRSRLSEQALAVPRCLRVPWPRELGRKSELTRQ
jgi:hypothetical protein